MYHNNDDERKIHQDPVNENTYDQPNSELQSNEMYNAPVHIEPIYNEPIHSEPVYSEPVYNNPVYSEPVYNNPVYSEPVYNDPANIQQAQNEPLYGSQKYSDPAHNVPVYNEHHYNTAYNEPAYRAPVKHDSVYSEPREIPWNMYSPGLNTNQSYPRPRNGEAQRNGAVRNGASRERSGRLGGFLRAVCLVVVCSLFSGIAAYAVMDYRFNRGDFTLNNQVVLGGTVSETRQDDNLTAPVGKLTNPITAQDIYDMARTQVVGIVTEAPGMFGTQDSSNSVAPVSGSGFIISSDGYILTNYHVIELAHVNNLPLSVVLNDGSSYDAKVVGFEASNDVAVIKIEATGLNPALIGNSDNIRVGQTIYAVGNPFGDLVYTMTDGIISALDRVVSVEGKSIGTFQFSAAVNRGNSGGPIYDTNGEVLGIVTAKVVRGNVEGIGFAIPINDAIEIAAELIEHGYLSGRPFMGITGQTVSPGHAEYYEWVIGTYIRSVTPGSAAEAAGMLIGDIITALNGEEIDSMPTLRDELKNFKAGDTTIITVWRNGDLIDLTITFDEDMHAGQPNGRPHQEPESPDPFANLP